MLALLFEYFAFALAVCLGAIQLAASFSRLRGLWLTPYPWANRLLGGLLIAGSAGWFFGTANRATPYPLLEGSQQGGTFLFAAIVATWATVFLVPLLWRSGAEGGQDGPAVGRRGLESLRSGSFWALRSGGRRRGGG